MRRVSKGGGLARGEEGLQGGRRVSKGEEG